MSQRLRLTSYARQASYALIAGTIIVLAVGCLIEWLAR